ncbi:hypothetical protein [Deinococcus sp. Leaf326]|uniref:hypothetical protein n=1 Tax=Deinococcus sp. Leaf326 TaxID=1736338 RepID=UPI0006F4E1D4|nr:hypothetical protein [Deinococcus sp. Leaf326]KQR40759.1 hypothetical protein ASF71_00905 [Deinococcus sp. Leaf326]
MTEAAAPALAESVHIYTSSWQTAQRAIKAHGLDPQRCEIHTSLEKVAGREISRLHLVGPWQSQEVLAQLRRPGRELVNGL